MNFVARKSDDVNKFRACLATRDSFVKNLHPELYQYKRNKEVRNFKVNNYDIQTDRNKIIQQNEEPLGF